MAKLKWTPNTKAIGRHRRWSATSAAINGLPCILLLVNIWSAAFATTCNPRLTSISPKFGRTNKT